MKKRNRRPDCQGKIRHADKTGAVIHLKKVRNAQFHAYACKKCGGWHIGRSNRIEKLQARFDQLLGPRPEQ